VHLTLRARSGVRSLRNDRVFSAIRQAIKAATKSTFRVVHFSVQSDHLHLIVEASDGRGLSSGVRGLSIRIALAINRALGRHGSVWGDRYHTRALCSPREVRNAVVYVLMNFRKHLRLAPSHPSIDPCSSAPWFDGFRTRDGTPRPPDLHDAPPTSRPATWLATRGWRRRGLISLTESPQEGARPT
jgi:putative transposase